ncbi:helix-turn-helix domain-containing protein [Paenibacillus sp. FA6]|uniref:helix-turn-helix domain-containing protein n=1 Tax=Paenibacillus sp. FA6 TaxID=3413029 RepID=UPI003F657118
MKEKEILKLVGARIRVLRKERGMSQESLGEKGGFHFSYIGQIERGEKNVALLNLDKIANALDVNVAQLFTYVNEEYEQTESDANVNEIIMMLRKSNPQQIAMAKNVLREIFNNK